MRKYLILAESQEEVSSIKTLLRVYDPSSKRQKLEAIVFSRSESTGIDTASLVFETLERSIADALVWAPEVDYRLTVIVSGIDLHRLNPLEEGTPFEPAVAMLILAFPEVHWIFGSMWSSASAARASSTRGEHSTPKEPLQENARSGGDLNTSYSLEDFSHSIPRWHALASLLRPSYEPLFDLSGLREYIKQKARNSRKDDGRQVAWFIPKRDELASSLDDELNYAYFNAYVAYRFGFRAIPIARLRLAEELFKERDRVPEDFRLSLEDLYPSMPDAENHEHLSDLDGISTGPDGAPSRSRPYVLKGLYLVDPNRPESPSGYLPHKDARRIIVTSDHGTPDENVAKANAEFLLKTGIRRVKKPFPGMFKFWHDIVNPPICKPAERETVHRRSAGVLVAEDQAGFFGRLTCWLRKHGLWIKRQIKPQEYYEEGFSWPPRSEATESRGGHSAPGRLNLLATTLVRRAAMLWQSGTSSAPEACRGAVIAGLAVEFYGCQVPTSSVDALILKHEFEVAAECQFSGVEYNIEVKPRLREVREELLSVFSRYDRDLQERQIDNAEMLLVNDLTRVLMNHAQFSEEKAMRRRLLELDNRLRRRSPNRSKIFLPFRFMAHTYLEWVSSSLTTLTIGALFWVVVVAGLYWLDSVVERFIPFLGAPWNFLRAFEVAMGADLGGMAASANPLNAAPSLWFVVIGIFGGVLGLIHFGLLVSILYTRLTLK